MSSPPDLAAASPSPPVVRRTPPADRAPRPVSYPQSRPQPAALAKRNSDPAPAAARAPRTQVKPFTKESLERLERKTVQLVREYGFQPRRKLSVEDGSRLPAKFEPFPQKLYGRPLEEIDNFIYDEVGTEEKYRSPEWRRSGTIQGGGRKDRGLCCNCTELLMLTKRSVEGGGRVESGRVG
ncbi:hypothetical protein Zmor_019861 [Zophobas morio]|uniref:Uncharacterized protein n=1 Tax=Zophobas morio TaxID=2755281 RepID=A0AA38I1P9_9CUCU|nr:hypothetical protein Zmor_019861 [Zophobas morio]